jgi:hypothetical protein
MIEVGAARLQLGGQAAVEHDEALSIEEWLQGVFHGARLAFLTELSAATERAAGNPDRLRHCCYSGCASPPSIKQS